MVFIQQANALAHRVRRFQPVLPPQPVQRSLRLLDQSGLHGGCHDVIVLQIQEMYYSF
jgi:hypothetical protein